MDDQLRVEVTDQDIAQARREWKHSCETCAPAEVVAHRYWLLRQLVHTQAQQIADDLRASRR
ncbi:MAG: hypothetical protein ABWY33_06205 [Cellulomonas sp.]